MYCRSDILERNTQYRVFKHGKIVCRVKSAFIGLSDDFNNFYFGKLDWIS